MIHSNANRNIWFDYNLRVHHNSLNDYGVNYNFDLTYRPNNWFNASASYNLSDYSDKYNFLKITRNNIIPEPPDNNAEIGSDNGREELQYYFSDYRKIIFLQSLYIFLLSP